MVGKIVTTAVTFFFGSATEVVVTFTCAGVGTDAGAVYWPTVETVPQALPEQPLPLTLQVTSVFEVPPVTVAVNS